MASNRRGKRKLPAKVQSNLLDSYLKRQNTSSDGKTIAKSILDELILSTVTSSWDICSSILDDILSSVNTAVSDTDGLQLVKIKKDAHTGAKTSTKTLNAWKEQFPWLVFHTEGGQLRLKCRTCMDKQDQLKLASVWANEGSPNTPMSSLKRHNVSGDHKLACKDEERVTAPASAVCDDEEDEGADDISISGEDLKLFNTIYFAAKSELPSESINGLLQLQALNGVSMKYKNLSWDSITDIQRSIAHVLKSSIVDDIKESVFYGLTLDESTDLTVEKRLSICIRYVKAGTPNTQFLCNVPLEDGRATTIVNCVVESLERLGISLSSCVSLATDGAAVMLGKKSGVGVQILSKYAPFCTITHCVAHRLNLACTDTIKKDLYMSKFREKFSSLYIFISSSSNRTQTLKTIQKVLQEPELSIKEPYSIRWLGLKNAVEAVYESYSSVLATLARFTEEKNASAKGLYKYFNSYKVALITAFMLDVHTELAVLSCELQRQNLLMSELRPLVDGTLANLESMKCRDGPALSKMKKRIKLENGEALLSCEKMAYQASMESEVERLRTEYLSKMKKNIKERFRKNDTDVYDDLGKVLEPMTVHDTIDSDEAIEHLATFYGYEKKVKIVHGNMIEGVQEEEKSVSPLLDAEKLQHEWPRLKGMISGAYSKLSTGNLCKRIILLHKDILPNCACLATIALCMQLTSVECERSFSIQNRLKNKYRSSLKDEKLDILLTISMLGPDLGAFNLGPCIQHWLRKKRRKGRLCAKYKPREKRQKLC